LPEGEKLNLAGDLVSWMREKRLEAWLAAKQEANSATTAGEVTISDEQVVGKGAEGAGSIPTALIEDAAGDATLEEEDEVELVTAALVEDDDHPSPNPTTSTAAETTMIEMPQFSSAGTVIIRAMQTLPATGEDGWLEEGSVVCFQDGRVLGTVSLPPRLSLMPGIRNVRPFDLAILPNPTSPTSSPIPYCRLA
jgi:H/ACA ribonucleoprotein complex non-core subunit NAF1